MRRYSLWQSLTQRVGVWSFFHLFPVIEVDGVPVAFFGPGVWDRRDETAARIAEALRLVKEVGAGDLFRHRFGRLMVVPSRSAYDERHGVIYLAEVGPATEPKSIARRLVSIMKQSAVEFPPENPEPPWARFLADLAEPGRPAPIRPVS